MEADADGLFDGEEPNSLQLGREVWSTRQSRYFAMATRDGACGLSAALIQAGCGAIPDLGLPGVLRYRPAGCESMCAAMPRDLSPSMSRVTLTNGAPEPR